MKSMKSIKKMLKENEKRSFSGKEISDITHGKINVVIYSDLANIQNIDELFSNSKFTEPVPCVLLYETSKNYGHWTLLIRINNDTIEHFDSYGKDMDTQLKFIPEYYRDFETSSPHLSWLVATGPYKKILTNKVKLQKSIPNINTCGRWVALRALTWNDYKWSLCKFIKEFKGKNSDEKATLLTMEF